MTPKHRIFLGIGSNIDRQANIESCLQHLRCAFARLRISPIYQSPSYGFAGADFHNLAVQIETAFTPQKLKPWLQWLEDRHGRDRSRPRYSNRTLDIDLLLCDDWCLNEGSIQLPRAEILTRKYVLKPLQDLAPEYRHPVAKKRLARLWQALDESDSSELSLVTYQ
ncbi:2-amino-4-hydroxy-6-hydroxymethyldihydropteridine diphosphokinase [Marinicella meishanensis]|uniref:2-amino-4-hydroxy-6- hydroxymethyldihydropteridine diphosphokinase n=1 Tax=Marinicella meishanensis TaxID=2873263 RepID=UPI001CBEA3DF|nr:2-amino-4-hydroxy-6-hydroxymethyldihydropteridine diphosphokinase [Marinicella sp. NBU2979]